MSARIGQGGGLGPRLHGANVDSACDPPAAGGVDVSRLVLTLYQYGYILPDEPVIFPGDSKKRISAFPKTAKRRIGAELFLLEQGEQPEDFKPMSAVGRGVEELRIHTRGNAYRVVYIARMPDAVFVLHAFEKNTQATTLADIRLAKARLQLITGVRS